MGRGGERGNGRMGGAVFKGAIIALIISLGRRLGGSAGRQEGREGGSAGGASGGDQEARFEGLVARGWIIVCGLSVILVLYGLFAFFVVGDKGPPAWDFGGVQDVPGQSQYSTYPFRGRTEQPAVQHVDRKPAKAQAAVPGGQSVRQMPKMGAGQ